MTLYVVANWNEKYENNRSRELKHMDWVPVPNKQDGDGYTELVAMQDGAGLYGCWVGIVLVASKCKPRGRLIRENGEPHTAQSIARLTHLPSNLIARTLIAGVHIKWLDSVPYENPVTIPHPDAAKPQPPAVSSVPFRSVPFCSVQEGGSGETKSDRLSDLPEALNTGRVRNKWEVWMTHRRAHKKPKSWVLLFNEQIEWLSKFSEPEVFEILSQSIRNGWQGLFEPKTYGPGPNRSSPRENPRNAGIVVGPTDYAAASKRHAERGTQTGVAGQVSKDSGASSSTPTP